MAHAVHEPQEQYSFAEQWVDDSQGEKWWEGGRQIGERPSEVSAKSLNKVGKASV